MRKELEGRIIRSLSGFYDVQTTEGTVTCRGRGSLRKAGDSPLTGDMVRISVEGGKGMIEKILPDHAHLLDNARQAIRMAGLEPREVSFRGGTDGAMLSWKGLPCPNLGTGGFNFHGTGECITAERMDKATEILSNVIDRYAK